MADGQQLEADAHHGPVVIEADGHQVIDCAACGFRHIANLPSAADLKRLYEEEFYQSEKDTYIVDAGADYAWKQIEMRERLDRAAEKLPSGSRRVLDIGCGPGDFLAVAKELGWDGVGVEPSPVAAKHASSRGLNVTCGFFGPESADQFGAFDFIHMSEVLEHIPNPLEILDAAVGLLKPGGVLCVSVPNDFNPLQGAAVKSAGTKSWWVMPKHHLNYFSFASLEAMFEGAGLDVLGRSTNFPMELFLLMGKDYTKDPTLGKELHGLRKQLDINLAGNGLYGSFYDTLAASGFGRLAIVYGQKKS